MEKTVPDGYSLVSFDAVSHLFTKVPLDKTINIILQRIYNNEIDTNIKRNDLKHLFLLCTKIRTFHLRKRKIYTNRWSTMGSPLGSVLADIHIGQLERKLLPALIEHVQDWHRYVDDMIVTVKISPQNMLIIYSNRFITKSSLHTKSKAIIKSPF